MKISEMKKKLALGFIAILGGVLVWVLFFWNPVSTTAKNQTNIGLAPTPVGGDFIVKIKNGDLSLKDLRDKVVILYFGYTQCPDICPTSLALLSQALNGLSEKELASVQSIFISVDPERDHVTRLEEYVAYFHPNIIGSTAEKKVIDEITKLYGASYRIVDSNSAMGYIVDHSSYTYIIGKKGKLQKALAHGTEPKKILEEIRKVLLH